MTSNGHNSKRPPLDALAERVEILAARNQALRDALRALVEYVRKTGGYMPHSEQLALRRAEALLAELERV